MFAGESHEDDGEDILNHEDADGCASVEGTCFAAFFEGFYNEYCGRERQGKAEECSLTERDDAAAAEPQHRKQKNQTGTQE